MNNLRTIQATFWVLLLTLSCQKTNIDSDYIELGKAASRQEAEDRAIEYLLSNFEKLPASGFSKIKYSFDSSNPILAPNTIEQNAIWYDKSSQQLAVEADIHSGTSCRWNNIDKVLMQAIANSNQGIMAANTLANPVNQQPDCLKP